MFSPLFDADVLPLRLLNVLLINNKVDMIIDNIITDSSSSSKWCVPLEYRYVL